MHAVKLEKKPRAENVKIAACSCRGAAHFLNSSQKFSLAPGFNPVMMAEKRLEAVSTASVCWKTR
jgi:hypothetical protein